MRPADDYRTARRNASRGSKRSKPAPKVGLVQTAIHYPQKREAARRLRQRKVA